MQVAKYWRKNQLRYRLQGVVQEKVERTPEMKSIDTDHKLVNASTPSIKVKVA